MKIGFDAKRAFHDTRGLGNYSRDTVRILSKYFPANEYFLFNTKSKNNVKFTFNPNAKEVLPESILWKTFPSLWKKYGIQHQIAQEEIQIYHGLSQELPHNLQKNVKKVVTIHDAIQVRFPELHTTQRNRLLTSRAVHACKEADKIIAISEQTKRDCIEYFRADKKKITVVYQGCNNLFRQPVTTEQKEKVKEKYQLPKQFLLIVGSIEKRKNAALIVKAMHRHKIILPLVIVGKGKSYIEEIKKLAEKYNLQEQVLFRHSVLTEDLPAIYSLSEIFVFPSIFEGFGIPILEAMCCKTPVITSKGSCFEETGGNAAIYIDPYSADELGDALIKVLTDKELKNDMVEKGQLQAEKFTDDKVANNLMNVYLSLINT